MEKTLLAYAMVKMAGGQSDAAAHFRAGQTRNLTPFLTQPGLGMLLQSLLAGRAGGDRFNLKSDRALVNATSNRLGIGANLGNVSPLRPDFSPWGEGSVSIAPDAFDFKPKVLKP